MIIIDVITLKYMISKARSVLLLGTILSTQSREQLAHVHTHARENVEDDRMNGGVFSTVWEH